MNRHIISDDTYNHIESETCWCNPRISQSEGETCYIHNSNYSTDIETEDREEVDYRSFPEGYLRWKNETSMFPRNNYR
jgi:hypothetical protein